MTKKRHIFFLALGVVLIVITGLLFAQPTYLGLCEANDSVCAYQLGSTYGQPLFLIGTALLIILLLSFWWPDKTWSIWKKVALLYLIACGLWISSVPVTCSNFLGCFNKENTSWISAAGLVAVSLGVAVYSKFKK